MSTLRPQDRRAALPSWGWIVRTAVVVLAVALLLGAAWSALDV